MKKLLSLLLICSSLVAPRLTVLADNSVSEAAPASIEKDSGASRNAVVYQNSSKRQEKKSNELVVSQKDFEEGYKPSKWEITKHIAKYLGITFINDIKSYVTFYPLLKVAQLMSFLALYFSTYAIYKKTGVDIPYKVSSFFTKNESLNIIGQNLYNVIPLTLASFLFKWGKDLYLFAKS